VEMARDGKPNGGFPPRLEIANNAIPTFPQVPPLFSLAYPKTTGKDLTPNYLPETCRSGYNNAYPESCFLWPVLG